MSKNKYEPYYKDKSWDNFVREHGLTEGCYFTVKDSDGDDHDGRDFLFSNGEVYTNTGPCLNIMLQLVNGDTYLDKVSTHPFNFGKEYCFLVPDYGVPFRFAVYNSEWTGSSDDIERWYHNNVFASKEEARKAGKKIAKKVAKKMNKLSENWEEREDGN